ncbi:MAG: hypothetical protein K2J08_05800 [Ruminococcus sp.]|nr:hypothetical protein [Ruminococcus sp.]
MDNKKKSLNTGKIVVLVGALIIMILVALWCGHLLKGTRKVPNDMTQQDNIETTTATTISIAEFVETTTTELIPPEITTVPQEIIFSETTTATAVGETVPVATANGEFRQYVMKLANPKLNIHAEPAYSGKIVGVITDKGSYVITDEVIDSEGHKWGLLENGFGWINLTDARNTQPDESDFVATDTQDGTNSTQMTTNNRQDITRPTTTHSQNSNNSNNGNSSGELLGIDADGDGWDDGFNPDAWCIICGYDSYWDSANECYHCSQGHTWNY